jgi:DNA-binding Lrp family transcriptional regulator
MKRPIRKKTALDGIDREILRRLYNSSRNLSGRQIARGAGISPSAIRPRLVNLQNKGIIKPMKIQGNRTFVREFKLKGVSKPITKRINSPRSVFWGINYGTKPVRRK